MRIHSAARRVLAGLIMLVSAVPAWAQDADTTTRVVEDAEKYQIVVSTTRVPENAANVPASVIVVSGDELRRAGTTTLGDALINVPGIDTGGGSDQGPRLPNIGLWGLKEFDALLVTLDGVPVGGPFNPSLSQIPVEEIDRIEVVKGPQGTMYGVSAFAGMVQVFTRHSEGTRGHIAGGAGSLGEGHGSLGWQHEMDGTSLRAWATGGAGDGFQDETSYENGRGGLTLSRKFGNADLSLDVSGYHDSQDWGSPIPVDAGEIVSGFEIDKNYAVKGAKIEHDVFSASTRFSVPVASSTRVENTLAVTHDRQKSITSFLGAQTGTEVESEGVSIEPKETTAYEDLRVIQDVTLGGKHTFVGGAAVTWGRVTASGIGFDFDQDLALYPDAPEVGTITVGDHRRFEDRRTFFGVYLHDAWSPFERLTISGGGRYDNTDEKLSAQAQEVGDPNVELARDSRSEGDFSGNVAVMVHAAPPSWTALEAANLWANYSSSFKPAAPNLSEAEGAEILDPEHTHTIEGGIKTRAWNHQLALDLSMFQMDFQNLVVSDLGPGGTPELLNAGKQRFKGFEVDAEIAPAALPGITLSAGYAHHDPRFVEFTFVTPDGELRNVSGKVLELAAKELANGKLAYTSPAGPVGTIGVWGAVRYTGERPLTRRNTFFADAFTEYDAGASWSRGPVMVSVTGRNLGDDRHFVNESEIGDSQFYVAPPRRASAEITYSF